MPQSKTMSTIEQTVSISIGYLISVVLLYFILPIFGHIISPNDSVLIVSIFTITSFARGYIIRRFFNWLSHIQSKKYSFIEALSNFVVGYIVSTLLLYYILPIFGHKISSSDSLMAILIFSVMSLLRSYLVRRFFNWIHSILEEIEQDKRNFFIFMVVAKQKILKNNTK